MMATAPADEDTLQAAQAFEVWCAIRRAEASNPELLDNPYFMAVRGDVYADMIMEFERL